MTQVKTEEENTGFWAKYGVILAAVLVLLGLILTPVKRWLNSIPYLWMILYPLLSLFSLYVLVCAIQAKESLITLIKWGILLIAAVAMAAAAFSMGAVFYSVGRTAAVIFIIVELGTFVYDAVR